MDNFLKKQNQKEEESRLDEFQNEAYPLMDKIFNLAYRLTQNRLDAEDLVQTTFLKAWRYYQSDIRLRFGGQTQRVQRVFFDF